MLLLFLDEPTANEFTTDRKLGWLMVGCPAVKERDFRRSEVLCCQPTPKAALWCWKIFKGSYTKQIFNQFVCNEVLPRMNA